MLSDKQKLFCDEYLIDLNATQAAIRAGYSKKTAYSSGQRLLKDVEVQKWVQFRMEERGKRTEITQDRVLEEYAKLAYFDPQKLYDENGNLLPVNKLDKDVAAALIGVDVTESIIDGNVVTLTKKVKYSDKKGALDSLARHLGMFNDKLHHSGNVDMNFTVEFVKPEHNGEDSVS